jgi:hypothetical protein
LGLRGTIRRLNGPTEPHLRGRWDQEIAEKAKETLLFLRLAEGHSWPTRVGRQAIEMEKLWQLQHRQ